MGKYEYNTAESLGRARFVGSSVESLNGGYEIHGGPKLTSIGYEPTAPPANTEATQQILRIIMHTDAHDRSKAGEECSP